MPTFKLAALWVIITLLVSPYSLHAQYRSRGGPPFGPGGSGSGYRFDPRDFIRRYDVNQNGVLEESELQDGRAQYMIRRIGERFGTELKPPINLDSLFRKFDERRREDEKRREESAKKKEDNLLLPGFEVEDDMPLIPGFDIPLDSPLLQRGPLENRYDRRILDRVRDTLRRYDRDRNDTLEGREMSEVRWDGDWRQDDLNNDQRMSKIELAERYARRYGNSLDPKKKKNSSSYTSSGFSKSSTSSGSSSSSSSKSSSSTRSYAESLMKRYDANKNGKLERDEWAKMTKGSEYDRNRDGTVTLDEIQTRISSFSKSKYSNKSKSSSRRGSTYRRTPSGGSAGGNVYQVKTTTERLAKLGVDSSFSRDDKNADGQLQMSEFAATWNDSKITEFKSYDKNGDWVITPQEWLAVQKEKKRRR